MTNLETNLLEVLTREAVRFCSRAVRLFPAQLAQMRTALIRDFHQWFCKLKAFARPYGPYDKFAYVSAVSHIKYYWPEKTRCGRKSMKMSRMAAEFRCQNCQFERTFSHAGTNFSSGKICLEGPRIIRGLYLSKEPLEYQKSATRFRFSFQKPDEEIYTNNN